MPIPLAHRCHLPLGVALALLALCGIGCQVVHQVAAVPGQVVTTIIPGLKRAPADSAILQAGLQRFADDFADRTTAALEDYARRVETPVARAESLDWNLQLNGSVVSIATGPNPRANVLDFLALVTLVRTFVEQRAGKATPPGAMDGWLETSRLLETNAWSVAARVLTPAQQAEFRGAIERWCAQNANSASSFFARAQEVVLSLDKSADSRSHGNSVFSLLGLDPMAGLDPAVREVTRSRMLGERAVFLAQHLPYLLSCEVELLSQRLLATDQVDQGLRSANRLSHAADSVSRTLADLPNRLAAERKAVLEALLAQEGSLQDLSVQIGGTLAQGETMADSLNGMLKTADALVKRFGVGEPEAADGITNSPPFNILDYARAAQEVTAMARQLDILLKDANATIDAPALDRRTAQLSAVYRQVPADARSLLDHAFLLAASLAVLCFGLALVYRRIWSAHRLPNQS